MTDIEKLEQQAIDAAIAHHWEAAAQLNKEILKADSKNMDANLRMGFASLQLENIKDAKKHYQAALRIQPRNPVATENLERIKILEESGNKTNPIKIKATLDPSLFLEIPGKTRSVSLVNLGQKNHLAELDIGEKVELKLRRRKIEVRTLTGEYVGYLPDDVSKRLIFFLENESEYSAHVKEANSNRVVIFVKEENKGPKVSQYSSFPSRGAILPPMKEQEEEESTEEAEEEEDDFEKLVGATETEEKEDYAVPRDEEESEE